MLGIIRLREAVAHRVSLGSLCHLNRDALAVARASDKSASMSDAALAEPSSIFDPRLRAVTLAVLLVVALSAFEGLAVAAALPQVAASLGNVGLLPWVITSYLLTSGVATVAAGALVDQLGARPVFRVSVILFTVSGVIAGLAPSMPLLVVARAAQGIGAGALSAVALTSVGLIFPRKLVGRAFAANATVWGVMSVGGPALAALLLAVASWRWIFLVNLPLGALALWMGWSALPERQPGSAAREPFQWVELVGLVGFTFSLIYAVDALDARSLVAGAIAVSLGWWLLQRNRGRAAALLAPRFAVDMPLGPLGLGIALLLVGGIGTQSFLPLYVSGGRGAGPGLTSASMVFMVLGWTTGANLSSRFVDRFAPILITRAAACLVPVGLAVAAGSTWFNLPLPLLFAAMVLTGLGLGGATNASLTVLRAVVSDGQLGRATSAHQFVRNLGFLVGNAVFGALLLLIVGQLTGDLEQLRAALDHSAPRVLTAGVPEAIQRAFATATGVAACASALASVPLWAVARAERVAIA